MNGMIKDMKSRTIVGNCRREFFGVDVHRGSCSDSTALNCYARGSNHGIKNRLHIVAAIQI